MKRHTDLLPKRILEFQKIAMEDLELSDLNIHDKSMRCPGIKAKWWQMYLEEQKYQKKLKEGYEELLDTYVKKYGKRGVPKFKAEIELKNNAELKQLEVALKDQDEVVRYLEGLYKIISAFNYEISNATAIMKLEN